MLPVVTLPTLPAPRPAPVVDAPPRCHEHHAHLARCPRCMTHLLAGTRRAA